MQESITYKERFNQRVLVVVCIVGLSRIIIELFYRNTATTGVLDLYLDIGFGLICLTTLAAIWRKAAYKIIYFTFFVPFIILLCLNFYNRNGLAGSTENNIYVGIIIIALTMRSKGARRFSIYLILGTIVSLILLEVEHNYFSDFTGYSTSTFNFIFMSIGVIIVIYYSKRLFDHRKTKLSAIRKELSENHRILAKSRSELEAQTAELEALNKQLEDKVDERLAILKEQRGAMKQYLDLTSRKLQKEHQGIHELTQSLVGASHEDISEMMLVSSKKLDEEIKSLVTKLEEDE